MTIPAGDTDVDVPFTVPDDGVIAPQRGAVVTLVVQGLAAAANATINVENTDVPTITMNGQSNNAVIPLDPQGDNSKLTDIKLSTGPVDGTVEGWSISWNPNEFVMWPTKVIGYAGITDLGSFGGQTPDGAIYDPIHGIETFFGIGAPPTDVYGQSLIGSSDWDTTTVGFSITVEKAATPVVQAQSRLASNGATGTANGVEILWNNQVVTGVLASEMLIGQGVGLSVQWAGPKPVIDGQFHYYWDVPDGIGGYVATQDSGYVEPLDIAPDEPTSDYIHFFWASLGGNGGGVGESVACSGVIDGNAFSVNTDFDVWTPASTFDFAPSKVGIGENGLGVLVMGTYPDFTDIPKKGAGVIYTGSVTMPQAFSTGTTGTWYVSQLVTTSNFATTKNNVKWQNNHNNQPNLLDTEVKRSERDPRNNYNILLADPPANGLTYISPDSPGNPLATKNPDGSYTTVTIGDGSHAASPMTETTRKDKFSDTLMFTPPGTDVISVPLQNIGWEWSATAMVDTTGKWILKPGVVPFITPAKGGNGSSIFPVWTGNIAPVAWEVLP